MLDVHGGGCRLRHCVGVMKQASRLEPVGLRARAGIESVSKRRLQVGTGVCDGSEGNAQ